MLLCTIGGFYINQLNKITNHLHNGLLLCTIGGFYINQLNKITYHLHNGLLLCTIDGLGEDHSVVEVVVGGCEDEVEDREQAYETGLMVSYFNGFMI